MTDAAGELVKYDAMCRAIDAAYEVDEVKDIRDKAIALEVYARQAHNTEAERRACEIRLRAERKAGAISAKLEKAQGRRADRLPPTMGRSSKANQLRNAGVSPKQAEQWEKLATVPTEQFNAALSDQTTMPTTSGIIRANAEPKQKPETELTGIRDTLIDEMERVINGDTDAKTARAVARQANAQLRAIASAPTGAQVDALQGGMVDAVERFKDGVEPWISNSALELEAVSSLMQGISVASQLLDEVYHKLEEKLPARLETPEETQERGIDRMKEAWADLTVTSQTRFLSWARDNRR